MKDLISRFAPAVIFALVGLAAIIFGANTGQGSEFLIGGGALLLVAVVVLLNALQILTNQLSLVASAVLIIAGLGLTYMNYDSINGPIQFLKEKERRYAYVVQGLKDIREAQIAYKKVAGTYTASFDTLKTFIMSDSIPQVKKFGSVPDGLTQEEALDSGYLRLDTNLVPAMDVIYTKDYLASRFAKHPLDVANLEKVPFTEGTYNMEASTIERTGGIIVPVVEVKDGAPFDETDVMKFGSLSDPSTSGNWKEEK
jgi:hypothetical protein